MGVFGFIDNVTQVKKNESLTAFFTLKGGEEFLRDHFDGFPVMPGVLLLESLKQAASLLLLESRGLEKPFYRLAEVRNARFGQFVKPGHTVRLSVRLTREEPAAFWFEGRLDPIDGPAGAKTLSADLKLAPVRQASS